MLSRLAQNAEPSATLSINTRAKQLAQQGQDVAKFTVGEPDFDTPENIKQAAHRALQAGRTKYAPAAGLMPLREALSDKFERENGLDYSPDQVIVSNGAKQVLYLMMLCVLEPGDDVLLAAPYWGSYKAQVKVCGANPVPIDCTDSSDLGLTPELLEQAVTENSKLLVLNSPCNPSGAVIDEDDLRGIMDVALDNDLWVISDEVYEHLLYDDASHTSPAGFSDEAYSRVITVNSFSKTYAMTGWRVGYAAGPEEVIHAAGCLQGNLSSAPNTPAQHAAIEALEGEQDSVDEMRGAFKERRNLLMDLLEDVPRASCPTPRGAFYAFVNVKDLLGDTYFGEEVSTSEELAESLLQNVSMAVVPGSAFGTDGYIRLSYVVDDETIEKGAERLAEFARAAE